MQRNAEEPVLAVLTIIGRSPENGARVGLERMAPGSQAMMVEGRGFGPEQNNELTTSDGTPEASEDQETIASTNQTYG